MNAIAPTTRLEHRQHQALTPRLQHAVRLLQLSSLDFAQEVQEAMGKNPFLEHDDSAPGDSAGTGSEAVGAGALSPPAETVSVEPPSASDMAADTWERDSWQQAPARSSMSSSGGGDGDAAMMEMVAADVSLREYLYSQVNVLPLSDRDRVLVGAIIESLDDDGYLRTSLDELAAMSELEPAVEDCEMSTALKLVQSLDPPGIAACSVSDCLRLQLPVIEDETERELARHIVTEHLDRLAQHDVAGLAKALNCAPAVVEAVCARIRHFDPRPGWRFGAADVHFVTPDVIVRKVRGQWTAALNPSVIPRVRLNQVYAELFQRHRDARHSELAAHLQEARWTVRNVEQRFSTILTVAQAILRRAYQSADVKTATRLLTDLARRLDHEYPSAAESVREGLDETLTVLTLNLSARLRRSLATTNAAESLLSRTRHVKRNVKRWRGGQMMLRWVAAGVLEAVKGLRRLKGYADMPTLVAALRARDRQLGLVAAQEERQIA